MAEVEISSKPTAAATSLTVQAGTPSPHSTPSPPLTPDTIKESSFKAHAFPSDVRSFGARDTLASKVGPYPRISSYSLYIILLFFVSFSSLLIYLAPYLSILLAFRLHPDDNFYSHRMGKHFLMDLRLNVKNLEPIPSLASPISISNDVPLSLASPSIPHLPSSTTSPSKRGPLLNSKSGVVETKQTRCPKNGITNANMDGFSGQYHELISLYFFAKLRKVPFCPRPWKSISDEKFDASDMFYWVGADKFGPLALEKTKQISSKVDLFSEKKIKDYYDEFEATLDFVRQAYFGPPKPRLIFYEKGRFDIAVHIQPDMWAEESEAVQECLWKLKIKYKQRKDELDIHTFSQGDEKPFESFVLNFPKMKMHLNKDVKSVFHHLVMADVLVVSKAKFARTAALLSSWGDIFYVNGANTPLKDWNSCTSLDWG